MLVHNLGMKETTVNYVCSGVNEKISGKQVVHCKYGLPANAILLSLSMHGLQSRALCSVVCALSTVNSIFTYHAIISLLILFLNVCFDVFFT